MFLTNHATLGIIIGQNIANPYAVIFLSLISHFLLDLIPHGDSKLEEKFPFKKIVIIALADLLILLVMLLILSLYGIINIFNPNILLGIFFAMLPDGLQLIYFISNKKLFVLNKQLHQYLHNLFTKKFDFTLIAGVGVQIIILIILLYYLIKF